MSFRINARIATVFLCAVPVLGLGIYIMMSKAHPIYERVFKTYDELNRVVQENLRGIRVVKAFVREEHEREKFGKVSDTIYRDFSRAEKITTFGSPLMQASVYTCILLSSWLGAHIIVAGNMTTGQLMSVLTYAMSVLTSLMMLSMVLMMLIISRASAERICEVLNERTDIANAPGAETVIPDGSVDFDGVSFSYGGRGGRSCLENIDLHIRSGETIGLIGGRKRQVHPRAAYTPALRCDGGLRQGRWKGRSGVRHRDAQERRIHGAAKERAVLRHGGGKPPLGQ